MEDHRDYLDLLPLNETVRILAAQEAQAQAEKRAARAAAPVTAARSLVGVVQHRSASSLQNEAWLHQQIALHGRRWLKMHP